MPGHTTSTTGFSSCLTRRTSSPAPVTDLPETDCLCVRFRGSHPEAPAQYRCLMAWRATARADRDGFSREITLIDYGITDDTEKFVTEISLPVAPQA